MLSETLIETFRSKLDELGLELADLRIGGTPNRPLVQVRIEWPASDPARSVTVDDCGRASRALETWLDGDGRLGSRYVLKCRARVRPRAPLAPHWARFVGVMCRHGCRARAGPGTHRRHADEDTVRAEPAGRETRTVKLADIRDARLAVDW